MRRWTARAGSSSRDMIRRLHMRDRVQLQEEPDHVGVWPDQAAHQDRDHRTPDS
jgi:hypothetical protein